MVSTRQVKAARALLAWSQQDLARSARLPEATVTGLEKVDGPLEDYGGAGDQLVAALRRAGVVFLEDEGDGPGVRVGRAHRDEGIRPEELTTENDD
jgi:hypothetical protein